MDKKWYPILITLLIVYAVGAYFMTIKPLMPEVKPLENTFPLFGLSFQATVLLLGCSIVMYYTWLKGGRRNTTHIIWCAAFFIYSLLFVGLMLQALGIPWANTKIPSIFFLWRQTQIIWAALVYYGIALIVFDDNKMMRIIPTLAIIIFGYAIFAHGLLVGPNDIEWTMYGFLHMVWIPVNIFISYLFYLYWKRIAQTASAYLSLGFAGIAFTYLLWAPWHLTRFYFVCFSLYTLSLVPVLIGMVMIRNRTKEPILRDGDMI
ncbi:MAG: hypothetical protein J7K68_03400 [Candidatus Diapherotrites archaeon]|nr:hypothetical protein [Candidatus Diapherotrites archaeon]